VACDPSRTTRLFRALITAARWPPVHAASAASAIYFSRFMTPDETKSGLLFVLNLRGPPPKEASGYARVLCQTAEAFGSLV
jgi:hypothetical protein